MGSVLASFFGAMAGQAVGAVLAWRYYLAPKFKRAGGGLQAREATPPPSQPTATTRGFVRHEGPVVVQHARWDRTKKTTRL